MIFLPTSTTQFPLPNRKEDLYQHKAKSKVQSKGKKMVDGEEGEVIPASSGSPNLASAHHTTKATSSNEKGNGKGRQRMRLFSLLRELLDSRLQKKHETSPVSATSTPSASDTEAEVQRARKEDRHWSLGQSTMSVRRRCRGIARRKRNRRPASRGPPSLPWPAALCPSEGATAFARGLNLYLSSLSYQSSAPAAQLSSLGPRPKKVFNVRRKPLPSLALKELEQVPRHSRAAADSTHRSGHEDATIAGGRMDDECTQPCPLVTPITPSSYLHDQDHQDYHNPFTLHLATYLDGDDPNLEGPARIAEVFAFDRTYGRSLARGMEVRLRVDTDCREPRGVEPAAAMADDSSSEISLEPLTPIDGQDLIPELHFVDEEEEERQDRWEEEEEEEEDWADVEMDVDLGMQLLQIQREVEMSGAQMILLS